MTKLFVRLLTIVTKVFVIVNHKMTKSFVIPKNKKERLVGHSSIEWCGREESNFHGLAATGF